MPDRIPEVARTRKMIHVPAGSALVGLLKTEATLTGFWIDQYPVTNAEFALVVSAHRFVPHRADHPATWVNWTNARHYLHKLSLELPTREQWEKAARGTDGRLYPWGDDHDPRRFNVLEAGIGQTTAVNCYDDVGSSLYGAKDMAGNVWEWTLTDAVADPSGKVVCGGAYDRSWFEIQHGVASSEVRMPQEGYATVGFRGVVNL